MGTVRRRRVRDARDRRADTFRALFDDHHLAVLGYALRRTRGAQDAADVLADTMLVAWRRLDEVPGGDATRLWLYGVARKVLANRRRSDGRRDRLVERLAAQVDAAVSDESGAVVDRLIAQEALARLGEQDREVLTLTVWEGLTPAEVAAVLGIPAATARTRLHRARARMRDELGERSASTGHHLDGGNHPVPDPEEVS